MLLTMTLLGKLEDIRNKLNLRTEEENLGEEFNFRSTTIIMNGKISSGLFQRRSPGHLKDLSQKESAKPLCLLLSHHLRAVEHIVASVLFGGACRRRNDRIWAPLAGRPASARICGPPLWQTEAISCWYQWTSHLMIAALFSPSRHFDGQWRRSARATKGDFWNIVFFHS